MDWGLFHRSDPSVTFDPAKCGTSCVLTMDLKGCSKVPGTSLENNVFVLKPLETNDVIQIKLTKKSEIVSKTELYFAITTSLPTEMPLWVGALDSSHTWLVGSHFIRYGSYNFETFSEKNVNCDLGDLEVGDTVEFCINSTGKLLLFLNGKYKGVLYDKFNVMNQHYFAVDLFGSGPEVSMEYFKLNSKIPKLKHLCIAKLSTLISAQDFPKLSLPPVLKDLVAELMPLCRLHVLFN